MRLLLLLCLSCSGADSARHGLGGSCGGDGDCHIGLICVADDPGGQCTKFCSADSQCGAGALCDDEGKCYQACNSDADCPRHALDATYGCTGSAPRRVCDAIGSSDAGAD